MELGSAPADLREGPTQSARPFRAITTGPVAGGPVPSWLSASRLYSTRMGDTIKTDMPCLVGPEVEAPYPPGPNGPAGGSGTAGHEPAHASPLHSSDTSRHNPPHIMM